jgi:hypothetical protein
VAVALWIFGLINTRVAVMALPQFDMMNAVQ